jgi:aryl-alcohol dehydrogenase-like predicted oxidoreductase
METTMQHRTLGTSGQLVSVYALGAMTFGAETPESDAFTILDAYLAAGGDFIDLADVYAAGASERIVGRWLADRGVRDQLVLASKARFPVGDASGPNEQGLSTGYLHRALDASLDRLGVEHLDLYIAHAGDPVTPMDEWLATLDGFVQAGKVRAIGVSNLRGYQLQRAIDTTRAEGLAPIVSLQPQYNLLAREVEWELTPCCEDEGVGLTPWSPLGGGWLTGKYRRDERPSGPSRLGEDPERGVEAYDARAGREQTWDVLDAVEDIAAAHGATMSQVALAWVTAQPAVSSTILGVRTLEQLEDNLGAVDVELTVEQLARLDAVSAPPTPDYPYALLDRMDATRVDGLR